MDASTWGFSVSILDPGAQFCCGKIRTSRIIVNLSLRPYINGKIYVHKTFKRFKISKMSCGCFMIDSTKA